MQSVVERRLLVYLLMYNCGSRGDVDNKPSVSKTFFKNVDKKWAQKSQVLRKKISVWFKPAVWILFLILGF